MLCSMKFIALFLLLAIPFSSAIIHRYKLTVMGQLKCNGTPIAGVEVKLMEHDLFKEDDHLGTDFTGEDGKYSISGGDVEIGDFPENYLQVLHNCVANDSPEWKRRNCRAIIHRQIPYSYVNGDPFEMGSYELWQNKGNRNLQQMPHGLLEDSAEESDRSDSSMEMDAERPVKKMKIMKSRERIDSSGSEDEEVDEDRLREEMGDFIASDDEIELEERDEDRRRESSTDDELDDEDLALLDENYGAKLKKRSRVVQEEDSEDEDDRDRIKRDLFGNGGDVDEEDARRSNERNRFGSNTLIDGCSEESSEDDFIEDRQRVRRRRSRATNGLDTIALDECRAVFGVDDLNGMSLFEDGELISDGEEEDEHQSPVAKEPETMASEDRQALEDKRIIMQDVPERYQIRRIPVKEADDAELSAEANWIWEKYFNEGIGFTPYENRLNRIQVDENGRVLTLLDGIINVLYDIRVNFFEPPFIYTYRKESLGVLANEHVWRILEADLAWMALSERRDKLKALVERLKNYQDDHKLISRRTLKHEDVWNIERLGSVEELDDFANWLHFHYDEDLYNMSEKRLTEEDREEAEPELAVHKFKKVVRQSRYRKLVADGLGKLAQRFGLSAEQFATNLIFDSAQEDVHPENADPHEVAYQLIQDRPAVDALKDAVYVLAMEFAQEPRVVSTLRSRYREHANVVCWPTKQGCVIIDEDHPIFRYRYLNKPVKEFTDDQFLYLALAHRDKLIELKITLDDHDLAAAIIDNGVFRSEGYGNAAFEWNALRDQVVQAMVRSLLPKLEKETYDDLKEKATKSVLEAIGLQMFEELSIGPFKPDGVLGDSDDVQQDRIVVLTYSPDWKEVPFGVAVDMEGLVLDHIRLDHLMKRGAPVGGSFLRSANPRRDYDATTKAAALKKLDTFLLKHRPALLVIAGESVAATRLQKDIIEAFCQNPLLPKIYILPNNYAKVFAMSAGAKEEFPDYPVLLRQGVFLGRYAIDPALALTQLCNEDGDILCVPLHPLQKELDQERLRLAIDTEFIYRICDIGLDLNRCITHAYLQNAPQYVAGLGPRKARRLLRSRQIDGLVQSRADLVLSCQIGPKVFMNCAGFFKFDQEQLQRLELACDEFDATRIHPEAYEWGRKVINDTLDVEVADLTAAFEVLRKRPHLLEEFDPEAFHDAIPDRHANKVVTLHDLRNELRDRFKDTREPMMEYSDKELFSMLTAVTPQTLYIGKLVTAKVCGYAYRKVDDPESRQAELSRDGNGWSCPWCCDFSAADRLDVCEHIVSTCPGKPSGVKVVLDNGITGFIPIPALCSDTTNLRHPRERAAINQAVYGRITEVEPDRFSVMLSCKKDDLQKEPLLDQFFDQERAEADRATGQSVMSEPQEEKALNKRLIRRAIDHPMYHNVILPTAKKTLSTMLVGEGIFCPSESPNMLYLLWKVAEDVYAKREIHESGKEGRQPIALGRKLRIGKEIFDDLEEVRVLYMEPRAMLARQIVNHKYYSNVTIEGSEFAEFEDLLYHAYCSDPQVTQYRFAVSATYPGKFMLGWYRDKAHLESITIAANKLCFRKRLFCNLDELIAWFKRHT
ncbi:unnamed protein product, partial [Mesorhabditis spiculigera]